MVKLDNYTRLKDIIFKNDNKMARHVENIELQQIIESEDFKDKFPIYGYLLKLQFKNGLARKELLKPSKTLMQLINQIKFPDSCYEHIMQYVSNEDLENFIKVISR